MTLFDIAGGVFLGVVMAVSLLWAMNRAMGYQRDSDTPWSVLAAMALPLVFFLVIVLVSSAPPQSLGG